VLIEQYRDLPMGLANAMLVAAAGKTGISKFSPSILISCFIGSAIAIYF
jgi:hypothetical protein